MLVFPMKHIQRMLYDLLRVVQVAALPLCVTLQIKSVVCLQQRFVGWSGSSEFIFFFRLSILLFFVGLEKPYGDRVTLG